MTKVTHQLIRKIELELRLLIPKDIAYIIGLFPESGGIGSIKSNLNKESLIICLENCLKELKNKGETING